MKTEPAPETIVQKQPGFVKDVVDSTGRYWFAWGSPTSLGIFRIFVGILAFINLMMIAPNWDAFFGENGYSPAWMGARFLWPQVGVGWGSDKTVPRLDILAGLTDPRITISIYVLICLAALFTAIGLWSRVSSIALAVGIVSLHHRDASVLHGGDTVLRIIVLYNAIAPSGAACSLDRVIALWKGRISSAPVLVSVWPQRLISYNVALLYLTTTWLKWGGALWQNGTATWYPARLAEFYRFPVPAFLNDLPFVYFTTYMTLVVEFSMATLVFFKPLRKYVLLAGIFMHIWIEYSMNIPLFEYLMCSMYVAFYDGDEIAGWAERIGLRRQRWHVNVRMPVGMQLKPTAVAFLDSIDAMKIVHYLPGDQPVWTAETHAGQSLPVGRAIWTRSVGCWIFGWLPGIWDRVMANALQPMPEPADGQEPESGSAQRVAAGPALRSGKKKSR